MNVYLPCEYSATVARAFRDRGHSVVTCDLLPTEEPSIPHHRGDAFDLLDRGPEGEALRASYGIAGWWDLLIGFPPCTYLTNSGVRWLHERPERWAKLDAGAAFFRGLLEADVPHVAIENPVPHKYAVERIGRKHDCTFQPWEHGHGQSKRTCLWLKNLPVLRPSNVVEGREQRVWRMAPGPERQKERSRFFPGVAEAMADQWIPHILATR